MCAKIVTNTIFKKRLTMSVRFCMKIKTSGYIIPSVYKIHSLKFPSGYKIPSLQLYNFDNFGAKIQSVICRGPSPQCVRFLDHAVLEIELKFSCLKKSALTDFSNQNCTRFVGPIVCPKNWLWRIFSYQNCTQFVRPLFCPKICPKGFSYQNYL